MPDEIAWEKFEADRIAAEKKAAEAKRIAAIRPKKVAATRKKVCQPQCVTYAKAVTGIHGTWGDGGRRLSLNSDGDIGDVVIFKSIHVGVVVDKVNGQKIVAESNFDFACNIRTRVLNDWEVRGYHKF